MTSQRNQPPLKITLVYRTAWLLGLLLLILLSLHPYAHILEALGLDDNSSCHWIQTSLSILAVIPRLDPGLFAIPVVIILLSLISSILLHAPLSRAPPLIFLMVI
ncbi:MAG TPA: hypothetical protein VNM22_09850 [Candidatus Limnocylindrales bacterium]|nr:hypothetical protein [Candidatus Limnocylindrales bacterium]